MTEFLRIRIIGLLLSLLEREYWSAETAEEMAEISAMKDRLREAVGRPTARELAIDAALTMLAVHYEF